MRLISRVFFAVIALVFALTTIANCQNLLHQPESVIYDNTNDRYLVSNYETGDIVAIDNSGNQTYFDTTLTRIAGLMTRRDTLYVASSLEPYIGLVAYSLLNDEMLFYLPIPSEGPLNDLDYDNRGYIYLSDYWDSKLWRVNMQALTCSLFVADIPNPNGVLCDTLNNRLLVLTVNEPGNPIVGVDFETGQISTVYNTGVYSLDGITRDVSGNLYISSWSANSCYKIAPSLTNSPELVSSGYDGPADIYIDQYNNILCVPNFYSNNVEFINLSANAVDEPKVPAKISYSFNYPNPFNANTTIEYMVPSPMNITVSIYDVLGNKISELKNGYQEAGKHTVSWRASDFASGVYFYRIEAESFTEVNGIMLLK